LPVFNPILLYVAIKQTLIVVNESVKSIEDKAAKTFILVLTINPENKEILSGACRLGKQTRTECVMMLKKCFVIPFFLGGMGKLLSLK
jgi:hypothetical protein